MIRPCAISHSIAQQNVYFSLSLQRPPRARSLPVFALLGRLRRRRVPPHLPLLLPHGLATAHSLAPASRKVAVQSSSAASRASMASPRPRRQQAPIVPSLALATSLSARRRSIVPRDARPFAPQTAVATPHIRARRELRFLHRRQLSGAHRAPHSRRRVCPVVGCTRRYRRLAGRRRRKARFVLHPLGLPHEQVSSPCSSPDSYSCTASHSAQPERDLELLRGEHASARSRRSVPGTDRLDPGRELLGQAPFSHLSGCTHRLPSWFWHRFQRVVAPERR